MSEDRTAFLRRTWTPRWEPVPPGDGFMASVVADDAPILLKLAQSLGFKARIERGDRDGFREVHAERSKRLVAEEAS